MKYYRIIILIFIASCGHKQSTLKISDIKFIDPESKAIVANRIDTCFLISHDVDLSHGSIDSIYGFDVYDSLGRVLYKTRGVGWSKRLISRFGIDGLLVYQNFHECMDNEYSYTYTLQADKKNLLRINKQNRGERDDTSFIRFDNNGYILEETNSAIKENQTKFYYDSLKRLESKTESDRIKTSVTKFYYTGNTIDSTITSDYYKTENENPYYTTTYYQNGLKKISLMQRHFPSENGVVITQEFPDSKIKIKSGIKDTIVINYIQSKR